MEQFILNLILFLIVGLAGVCLMLFVMEVISVVRYNKKFDKGKKEIDHIVHQIRATR